MDRHKRGKAREAKRKRLATADQRIHKKRVRRGLERTQKAGAREAKRRVGHLCALQRSSTEEKTACPLGWTPKGIAGLLVYKGHEKFTPFQLGGAYNKEWTFDHPYLCCAEAKTARLGALYGLSRKCASDDDNGGLHGLLLMRSSYRYLNPFHRGGEYNERWRWAHPYVCRHQDVCLMGKVCPHNFEDHGYAGIVLWKKQYKLNPFRAGKALNTEWQWAHPKVCCPRQGADLDRKDPH